MAKGSGVSGSLLDAVMHAGGLRCAECGLVGTRVRKKYRTWSVTYPTGTEGVSLSVDHIIPQSRGGVTEIENLRVLCTVCNSKRGASMSIRQTFSPEEHW